jgi:hypothetical protein
MFGRMGHNWKAYALAALLFAPSLAFSEYEENPERVSPIVNHPGQYFTDEIAANRQRFPQGANESDRDYNIRMAKLDPNYTPPLTAPGDTAGTAGQPMGTADLAEKLHDAALLAKEGKAASTAEAGNLQAQGFASMGDLSPQALADMQAYIQAAEPYAANASAMDKAMIYNANGKTRLRYDADDEGAQAGTAPSESQVQNLVDSISAKNRKAMEDRGIDPQEFVERLLSGEIDKSDPNAILRELGETRQLSTEELAEVKALADVKLAELGGRAGGSGSGSDGEGRGAGDRGALAKADEKDPSKTTNPGLAGIAIRLINREVMGYRIGDLLGIGKDKKAGPKKALSLDPNARAAYGGKVVVKKRLTAVDFYNLQGHGITAPRHGSNIFKMAHRQYREYGKWRQAPRKGGRVAALSPR